MKEKILCEKICLSCESPAFMGSKNLIERYRSLRKNIDHYESTKDVFPMDLSVEKKCLKRTLDEIALRRGAFFGGFFRRKWLRKLEEELMK